MGVSQSKFKELSTKVDSIEYKVNNVSTSSNFVKSSDFTKFKDTVNSNFVIIGKTIPLVPSEI